MGTLFAVLCAILIIGGNGSPAPMASYDAIVIGLGASGTGAATALAAAGKKVLALEAMGRIGGRVNTVPFGDGIVELGAEWIHGTNPSSVYDLAVKNNITVLPQDMSFRVYDSDGSSKRNDLINELVTFCVGLVDDPPEAPEPLGQYMTRRLQDYLKANHPAVAEDSEFLNEFLPFMDLIVDNYEASNSWNDVTTATKYEDLGGHLHMSWHTHGYKTLFEILMNTYNNGPGYPNLEIKLNTEVTKIQWPQKPEDNVVVSTKDGATYTAKYAIVTVSLGVLKERYPTLFSPQLPLKKVTAVNAISFGLLDKVELQFDKPWWSKKGENYNYFWDAAKLASIPSGDEWLSKITFLTAPMGSENVMTVWFSGDRAKLMEVLPEDVIKTKVMEVIRRFMGADMNVPEPIAILRSTWYSNPYTRGSYSYDNLVTPQHPTARTDLGEPLADSSGQPRLLFAGEATNPTHFSTVHGALDTGRREAARILNLQSKM